MDSGDPNLLLNTLQENLHFRNKFSISAEGRVVQRGQYAYAVDWARKYCDPILYRNMFAPNSLMFIAFAILIWRPILRMQKPYRVGIIAFPVDGSRCPRVIYTEQLRPGQLLDAQIAEVATRIEAGKYDLEK